MPFASEFIEDDIIKLDQVDRDILGLLQVDGRSSASLIGSASSSSKYVLCKCKVQRWLTLRYSLLSLAEVEKL